MATRTVEEYEATAMLLGMEYDPLVNTFRKLTDSGFDIIELDADTMEEMDMDAIVKRVDDLLVKGVRMIHERKK